MVINAIDLFCGCGGLTKGMLDAGINVVCGIDHWQTAINTYQQNFDHLALCKDLTKLKPSRVDKLLHHQKINLIIGGPPCQGFSIAGKRDLKDPRNSLFKEFVKFVEYFQPKMILLENVVGILSMKNKKEKLVKDIIVREFNKIGYDIKIKKLIASDYRVPQIRKRVFFLGKKNDSEIKLKFPHPKGKIIPIKKILLHRDEISDKYYLSQRAINGIKKKKERMKKKGHGFGAQFLDLNKPCYTIPARYWKDGYDALVKYSDTEIRRLTEREVSRVQTFPDDFEFTGNKKEIYQQLGNAVPCKLAYYLGKKIKKILNT